MPFDKIVSATPPSALAPPSRIRTLGLLLVIITLAAYLPALRCGYIWDDDRYVLDNQTLRSPNGLQRIWCELRATPQYYPLVFTTYWLEHRLWGFNPVGYHLVNILLHAAGAVLLWRILALLEVRGAWVAAALFALHPVNVESVAWITERKNVLSGVFYFAAGLLYLRGVLGPGGRISACRYAASLLLFICALLSKTVTGTLPAAILLVLLWKRPRLRWSDVAPLAPMFLLGIAGGLLTAWLEKGHVGATGEDWSLSLLGRCLLAGRIVCFYAAKLICPHPLIFIYPRWQIDTVIWWQYLYPLAVLVVIGALWRGRRKLGLGPLVATLFFAGTLFPALGFFNVYPMLFSFVADHFLYLAGSGLIALVVSAAARLADLRPRQGKTIAAYCTILVLLVFTVLTWRQCSTYKNAETLWRDTLAANPDAWMAHINLGTLLLDQGRNEEAADHCLEALRLRPDSSQAYYNLGTILLNQGRLDEAIHYYQQPLLQDPNLWMMHLGLGLALHQQGKLDEAISHYLTTLRIKPDCYRAAFKLAAALDAQGCPDRALPYYRQAMQIRPDSSDAIVRTAWILATHPDPGIRRPQEAIDLAGQACRLTGHRDPAAADALAAAYAAAGQFDRARTTARDALNLAFASGRHDLAGEISERLALYQHDRPYQTEPAPSPATSSQPGGPR